MKDGSIGKISENRFARADLEQDLTQETFYQAYKSAHRYNGNYKISVWLCQIAKHLYFDYLKKEKTFVFEL